MIKTGPSWLHERIADGNIVLLDGATGTELERRGVPMHGKVWCGDAILAHADVLRQIHEDYIRAGARVIIANTYATARHVLEPAGFGKDVERANHQAVEIARAARERAAEDDIAVAGSISDFIVARDDPTWCNERTLRATYREQAEVLAESGVDLLVMEMMQEPEVAVPAVEAAIGTGLPVWLGCSCRRIPEEDRVGLFDYPHRDFRELLDAVAGLPVAVINIMHSEVPDIPAGIDMVRERWPGPMGAYPNSGHFVMPNWQFVDIVSPQDLVDDAKAWIDKGVQIIGGCCGIGPQHIAALSAALPEKVSQSAHGSGESHP